MMTKPTNSAVQEFLNKIMLIDKEKHQILEELRKIVLKYYPKTEERMMYGGIIFSLEEDYGGIFAYKNHVSFEFSLGYKLKDPQKLLEGGGKFRRHLKFRSLDDTKMADFFVGQITEKLFKNVS